VQVAEARKLGDVGERTRQGDTKVKVAEIDAEVIRNQNLRNQEVEKSKLELRLVETECRQRAEQATVQVITSCCTGQATVQVITSCCTGQAGQATGTGTAQYREQSSVSNWVDLGSAWGTEQATIQMRRGLLC
jgi:hypothetical protein